MDRFAARQPAEDGWEDGALARAISGGARAAEAEFCRRFAPRIRLYGLRHLRSEDAAQDLTHDVLLRSLAKLRAGEVREPERIASFVLGVARMLVHERRRRREDQLNEEHLARFEYTLRPPDPLAADRLRQCLDQLAERERAILLLTYYADQSTENIAASLGLKSGTVRVIRHRGVIALRDCVGAAPEASR